MTNSSVETTKNFYNNVGKLSWSAAENQHYHVGVFEHENDSMSKAQQRTVQYIERKLELSDTDLVLDLGCGSGLSAIEICKSTGCKIVGVNISKEQLKIGSELVRQFRVNDRVKLMNMDAHDLKFKPNIFDKVYAIESIMHMDREKIIEQVNIVTKPEGNFSLCDWFIKKTLTDVERRFLETITCGEYITINEYSSIFKRHNFIDIDIEDWTEKIRPTYNYWTTVTDEMRELIPDKMLKEIENNCKVLSDIAIDKLGYLQITAKNGKKNGIF